LTCGDLPTRAGAALVLLRTGLFAAFVPARWAARLNPTVALPYA